MILMGINSILNWEVYSSKKNLIKSAVWNRNKDQYNWKALKFAPCMILILPKKLKNSFLANRAYIKLVTLINHFGTKKILLYF